MQWFYSQTFETNSGKVVKKRHAEFPISNKLLAKKTLTNKDSTCITITISLGNTKLLSGTRTAGLPFWCGLVLVTGGVLHHTRMAKQLY